MKKIILISILFSMVGCAHQIKRDNPVTSPTTHEYSKNYKLGEVKTVAVGEPLIQVKDYYVTKFGLPELTASEDFSVTGTLLNEKFTAGTKFEVKGKIVLDKVEYSIAKYRGADYDFSALLVKDDGTVHSKAGGYNPQAGGFIVTIYNYDVIPSTVKLVRTQQEKIDAVKGYQNYEFLYNGKDRNSMRFTYREFSPEGMARTAFYQDLTYDANSTSIRYKGFKINVLEANSEQIKFIIVEEDSKKAQ